jgi:hypothetical protein
VNVWEKVPTDTVPDDAFPAGYEDAQFSKVRVSIIFKVGNMRRENAPKFFAGVAGSLRLCKAKGRQKYVKRAVIYLKQ